MIVVCNAAQCRYYDKRGFCAKETIGIDGAGMCKCLWRNGQARQLGLAEGGPLKPITIYEADFKEIIEEKEAAECPSEDLLNEVSATENE